MVEKKKSFSELSPGKKRLFALLGAAGVVIIFAAASEMLFSPASKDKAPKNDVQRNVLTDTNTRQLGIDGLSASVQRMRREITELSNRRTSCILSGKTFQFTWKIYGISGSATKKS